MSFRLEKHICVRCSRRGAPTSRSARTGACTTWSATSRRSTRAVTCARLSCPRSRTGSSASTTRPSGASASAPATRRTARRECLACNRLQPHGECRTSSRCTDLICKFYGNDSCNAGRLVCRPCTCCCHGYVQFASKQHRSGAPRRYGRQRLRCSERITPWLLRDAISLLCFPSAGEDWVKMDDSRYTCLQCLHTLVRNTPDAQPLYDDVLHFYASMSMVRLALLCTCKVIDTSGRWPPVHAAAA